MEKYKSLIVPDLYVDTQNYITEIIIKRRYEKYKKVLPKSAFWRSEYKEDFKDIRNEYVAELTQVKKLLNVFSPAVVINYISNNTKILSYRYIKKEVLKDVVLELFKLQIEYADMLKVKKSELQLAEDKVEYIERAGPKQDSLVSKGL